MAELVTDRILPFTSEAARWYAELMHRRERMGRPMATADAMIASTALAHEAALAIRDGAGELDGAERGQPIHPRHRAPASGVRQRLRYAQPAFMVLRGEASLHAP
jgi:hypothetical protein